jgi:pepF/M3 family oligoendopeptidase
VSPGNGREFAELLAWDFLPNEGGDTVFTDLKQTWDLEAFFPGGSESPQFAAYLSALTDDIGALTAALGTAKPASAPDWRALLDQLQGVTQRVRHAGAFVSCLTAQNTADRHARQLATELRQIQAGLLTVLTGLDTMLMEVPDERWAELLDAPELASIAFVLDERRRRGKDLLPAEQEKLINDLSVDGYHGWSDLYDLTTGNMTITLETRGKKETLSPGQAANRMSDPDPAVRAHIMERWEEAWQAQTDYCALALNHLAGFRINLYKHRGWDDVLREPLEINRMRAETLAAMWTAINQRIDRLQAYLARKRELLGVETVGWQDVEAPIGESRTKLTYDQAASFIVEQFERFSPRMAALATRAFNERWIEAEDRPGKRMGGFCTSFPEKQQSRIFVTFSGTMGNLATLAHELGHAYHGYMMKDLEPFNQQYAMAVAETASTFAELIVAAAAVKHAATPQERLALVEDNLKRAATLLMNIQARFLFETRFYAERRRGPVSVARLNALMEQAQRDAFAESLGRYHPTFWASKLHFYITRTPFYNFPYTFGYLFSAGVYAKALAVGPTFEDNYGDLLRDTGRMRVEDLAAKHLGADLTTTQFWGEAVDNVLGELDEFLRLTAK